MYVYALCVLLGQSMLGDGQKTDTAHAIRRHSKKTKALDRRENPASAHLFTSLQSVETVSGSNLVSTMSPTSLLFFFINSDCSRTSCGMSVSARRISPRAPVVWKASWVPTSSDK